jgi:hypothetical protein
LINGSASAAKKSTLIVVGISCFFPKPVNKTAKSYTP